MLKTRHFYRAHVSALKLPDLIEVQTSSYKWLFEEGIRELLDEISPVQDFTGKNLELEFADYKLETPKIDEATTQAKNLTYKAPLKCKVILHDRASGKKKEAEVFLGDFPLMTQRGTFIINGIERVVVSQIVRSYGVLFVAAEAAGRKLFGAKVIPARGAWLEFETSSRDQIHVKVDRKRKIPITMFLRVLGLKKDEEIMAEFADVDDNSEHPYIKSTLDKDPAKTYDEALVEVYKRIRPGDLATSETAKTFIDNLFFNPKRYDLGKVGRYKFNRRLGLTLPQTPKHRILTLDDMVAVIKEIIRLNNNPVAQIDDIDHLKNRRVRAVGELVQGRIRVGLLRVERIIKDRMSVLEPEQITPGVLVNSRPVAAVLQEFFASSQLSQFMDQTNPVAELEHKRRLSATGPGGLSRERAGFEVRDVHNSHYGRICPISTPEGPNIGLVSQLATYAKVNEYGFIETPYLVVEKNRAGKPRVTQEIVYLDAAQEEDAIIAPASAQIDEKGYFKETRTVVRKFSKPSLEPADKIQYIDISAKQIVSISTALIPFVEHDDAARAMMGSNMQRQAVPLIRCEAPVVGTGMEEEAAAASGQTVVSEEEGVVAEAAAAEVVVKAKNGHHARYPLQKFVRSNQGTCLNQRPIVQVGERVKKGQAIADGAATHNGELALGQNLLVAYVSLYGLVYEDAIVISERLVKEDLLSSVHIEKYAIEVRDTKLGPEVITRDIPNISEEALSNLDEDGIVRIGAEVASGDILVGKISPKGETELSAEEKLLRAIFGEKAKDVKDTSLRMPHGERGKIVDIKMFSKEEGDELPTGVYQMVEISVAQWRKISVGDKLAGRHGNKGVIARILPVEDMPRLENGTPIDIVLNPLGVVSRMNLGQILETHLGWAAEQKQMTVASPVFEGVPFETIQEELKSAGLPVNGKTTLYDGRTGEPFDQPVTVGSNYIMKLIHLVDDKVHARSTGPYSMVTQQPLGGKAQFGGQRFGEMEVWALEAYGAAHTLQEMLTIKSDDVVGRARAYESIIRGTPIQKPYVPASFYVLMRELQSLALNVELVGERYASEAEEKPLKDMRAIERAPLKVTEASGPTQKITTPDEEPLSAEEVKDRELTELKISPADTAAPAVAAAKKEEEERG